MSETSSTERAPAFRVCRNEAYGRLEGQRLDLYRPLVTEAPGSAVVVFHGGGWQEGDPADPLTVRKVCEPLALRGYLVASVGYRLAPRWHFPAQLDDAQLAVRWLRAHAGDLGIEPWRIGAVGGSAGGHLASLLGTGESRDPTCGLAEFSSRVRCVVSLLSPSDLRLPNYLATLPGDTGQLMRQILTGLMGTSYNGDPELWQQASPLFQISPESAPFFIVHGRQDDLVPVDQAIRLARALAEAGVEVHKVLIPGMKHDVEEPAFVPAVDRALEQAWSFLDRHLRSVGTSALARDGGEVFA